MYALKNTEPIAMNHAPSKAVLATVIFVAVCTVIDFLFGDNATRRLSMKATVTKFSKSRSSFGGMKVAPCVVGDAVGGGRR